MKVKNQNLKNDCQNTPGLKAVLDSAVQQAKIDHEEHKTKLNKMTETEKFGYFISMFKFPNR